MSGSTCPSCGKHRSIVTAEPLCGKCWVEKRESELRAAALRQPAKIGNGLKVAITETVREAVAVNAPALPASAIQPPTWKRTEVFGTPGLPLTIETAIGLIKILKAWVEEQSLPDSVKEGIRLLCGDIKDCLAVGSIEIDEALKGLDNGAHILRRWKGGQSEPCLESLTGSIFGDETVTTTRGLGGSPALQHDLKEGVVTTELCRYTDEELSDVMRDIADSLKIYPSIKTKAYLPGQVIVFRRELLRREKDDTPKDAA